MKASRVGSNELRDWGRPAIVRAIHVERADNAQRRHPGRAQFDLPSEMTPHDVGRLPTSERITCRFAPVLSLWRFRTSLQKKWSLFPGNGFSRAETNAPEWLLRQTSRLKETNHAHETRLIRVIPRQLGKSRFAQDCMVGLGGLEQPV
jgi:hypothetical protein